MKLPTDVSAAVGQPLIDLGSEIAEAILRTVKAGWKFALESPDVNANAREVVITERPRDGMRRAVDSGMFEWENEMFVLPGTESRSNPDIPVPDGLIDIPILVIETAKRFKGHNPHAIIECKRVAGDDPHLCRQYVVGGIDRFQTGKYARTHSIGFMAGYLIAGDAELAVGSVNHYLNGKSRSAENLQPSILIAESWAWQSCHQREGKSRIELHHALLSFSPLNFEARRSGADSASRAYEVDSAPDGHLETAKRPADLADPSLASPVRPPAFLSAHATALAGYFAKKDCTRSLRFAVYVTDSESYVIREGEPHSLRRHLSFEPAARQSERVSIQGGGFGGGTGAHCRTLRWPGHRRSRRQRLLPRRDMVRRQQSRLPVARSACPAKRVGKQLRKSRRRSTGDASRRYFRNRTRESWSRAPGRCRLSADERTSAQAARLLRIRRPDRASWSIFSSSLR